MTWLERFDLWAAQQPQLEVTSEELMSRHTSFRIGGAARRMAFPRTEEELCTLLRGASVCGAPVLMIGNGSNLLVADEGIDRLVIDTTRHLRGIELLDDGVTIRAQAGASLAAVAVFAMQNGLTGMEFAHGIPGSLGGAVVMNAGAYGGEMAQLVRSVTAFAGDDVCILAASELAFGYRQSAFSQGDAVVLAAELTLTHGDAAQIRARMEELMAKRKHSQPLEYPSAGSTFKRPQGYYAGPLIEKNGFKGVRVGGAEVSEKHAGFLINRGGATCRDVLTLIEQIQATVYERDGVRLETEVKIIR